MNCEAGCLAVCVRSVSGNLGKICVTERLATEQELVEAEVFAFSNLPVWITDVPFVFTNIFKGKKVLYMSYDSCLRIIKPDELPVETLEEAVA